MNYLELRKHYIDFFPKGLGLDIGPFDQPFIREPAMHGFTIHSVDRWCPEELGKLFPEIRGFQADKPTFLHDVSKDGLSFAEDESYNFIICSHVIEHVANPFWLIEEMYRIIKEGGVIYIGFPDARFSDDKGRKYTSYDELIDLYTSRVREVDDHKVIEYLTSPELQEIDWLHKMVVEDNIPDDFIDNIKRRSFHVHVWDSYSLPRQIADFVKAADLRLRLLEFHIWEDNGYEGVIIVQKDLTIDSANLIEEVEMTSQSRIKQ